MSTREAIAAGKEGILRVSPVWTAGSQEMYSQWLTTKDPRVALFRQELSDVVYTNLGSPFPKAKLPPSDADELLEFGAEWGDNQPPTIGAGYKASKYTTKNVVDKCEKAVHVAVNTHNPRLFVNAELDSKIGWRQVTYVLEGGVIHCIYSSFLFQSELRNPTKLNPWVVAWPRDGSGVSAFLSIHAYVLQI